MAVEEGMHVHYRRTYVICDRKQWYVFAVILCCCREEMAAQMIRRKMGLDLVALVAAC